jgi:hypothetical protein
MIFVGFLCDLRVEAADRWAVGREEFLTNVSINQNDAARLTSVCEPNIRPCRKAVPIASK